MNFGRKGPIEVDQTLLPEALHFGKRDSRVGHEARDVNALAHRRERGEISLTAREHVNDAVMVQTTQVVKRDADLQNALVEAAHVPRLRTPEELEGFVLLEKLASVELGDPFEQLNRRRLVAGLAGHASILATKARKHESTDRQA
jgi:hypothetical protein